ncbi:unnamed protein product [Schistosoma intercalatum]|nr:unnamed protein product [Schistosoma intercalatum]CAH8434484.1 unnamed protein product [Schistosoma intercalatum]
MSRFLQKGTLMVVYIKLPLGTRQNIENVRKSIGNRRKVWKVFFKMYLFSRFNQYFRIINQRDRRIGQYLSRFWMSRKSMWALAFYSSLLTLGNNTNNSVESLNCQIKRYVRKMDSLHKCIYKVFKWITITSSRRSVEDTIMAGRTCKYDVPQRILPSLNMLTPFARLKVLYELKKMRFAYVESENGDWLFTVDCGQHYEVDVSTCECNCRIFVTCRYPFRKGI